MRILLLSSWFPFPPDNGSRLRVNNLLRTLSDRHQVTLATFAGPTDKVPTADEHRYCDQVLTVPIKPAKPRRRSWLSSTPRILAETFDEEFAAVIRSELESKSYDLILANQLGTSLYALPFKGFPRVLDEVELGAFYSKAQSGNALSRLRHLFTLWKLKVFLKRIAKEFDLWTVVSREEERLVRETAREQAEVALVPNGIDLSYYKRTALPPEPYTLVFSGSLTFSANYDAYKCFLEEIFPLVLAREPRARLLVTGRLGDIDPSRLGHSEHVEFGYFDDIRSVIGSRQVCIVPLRMGGGTRVKILLAMALGTPIVSTSKGAEGLEVKDGEHLLIADDPAAFARAIIDLFRDGSQRDRLAANARQLVEQVYNWELIGRDLEQKLRRIVAQRKEWSSSAAERLEKSAA